MVDAYTQLKLDRPPQDLLVVNTHKGLYRYKNLVYGVASALGIFQQTMDTILQGIPKTCCYLDDILCQGSSLEDCVQTVRSVLARLNKFNVKLRPDKCIWFSDSVEYLGHLISKDGRSPSPRLTQAIEQFKEPSNVKELRSFLGLLNFYASFLPNISTVLKPLRTLTEKSAVFNFSEECKSAFQEAKQSLLRSNLLVHYDPAKEMVVQVDASPVGLGCVLSHVFYENNKKVERPVLFASCTLTSRQQRYSQLDREAMAVIFAVTKLRKFLWGRHFTLITDNAPIRHIFNPEKSLPVLAYIDFNIGCQY